MLLVGLVEGGGQLALAVWVHELRVVGGGDDEGVDDGAVACEGRAGVGVVGSGVGGYFDFGSSCFCGFAGFGGLGGLVTFLALLAFLALLGLDGLGF